MSTNGWADRLRQQIRIADQAAARNNERARRFGIASVKHDRELAQMPCDIDRDARELVVHLGYVHHVTVPIGWWTRKPFERDERIEATHREAIAKALADKGSEHTAANCD